MYTLSKQAFTDKLIDLKSQGVDVRVLLSHRRVGHYENTDTYDAAQQLHDAGVPVYNSTKDFTFTHAKYWIIDGKTTFVYSGNWSPRSVPEPRPDNDWPEGAVNRESGVAINDAEVTDYYEDVFTSDWSRGTPWSSEVVPLQFISLDHGALVDKTTNIGITSSGYQDVQFRIDQGSWNDIEYSSISLLDHWVGTGIHTLELQGTKDDVNYGDTAVVNCVEDKTNPKVLISEVDFNPVGSDTEGEFIELANTYDFDVRVDNWYVMEDNNRFTFMDETILKGVTTYVIARDDTGFKNAFGFSTDYIMESMSLTNSGDAIGLYDSLNNLLDAVAWGDGSIEGANNPISLDDFDEGETLQRVPIYQDTNDITNDFEFLPADPKNDFKLAETSGMGDITPSWQFSLLIVPLGLLYIFKKKKNKF